MVTAVYPTGNKNGFYIQMADGTAPADHTRSTGVFVYNKDLSFVKQVKIGDSVTVTGQVSEYYNATQLTASKVEVLSNSLGTVTPKEIDQQAWADKGARENYEGMLLKPTGLVVTDNYSLNTYGEIGLAFGDTPLKQPTAVGAPDSAEAKAQVEDNEARAILLDDGSTWDYMKNADAKKSPLPYLDLDHPVTVGAEATFNEGVVLDYSFDKWRLQPTQQQVGTENMPVAFSNVREDAPKLETDVTVASFNVLNYFPTLGNTDPKCKPYTDREGNPTTANRCKMRGAYDADSFERQQSKIVNAINKLDASVVALEEIEDSSDFGKDRDDAIKKLVEALNAKGGNWSYVPSPASIPTTGDDVIRTGIIYKKDAVSYVDGSTEILDSPDFTNARAPLAATFATVKDPDTKFVVIANHFKSKGGSGSGDNASPDDDGNPSNNTGGWNGDRTRQAKAVVEFSTTQQQKQGTDLAFLAGDFNAYAKETPITTITGAGYVDLLASESDESYLFGGMVGSLDHIFASPAAAKLVTDQEIWTINAHEPIALEYSRNNYNVTQLYSADPYRASDHNPEIVGFNVPEPKPSTALDVQFYRDNKPNNTLDEGELQVDKGYVYVKDAAGKWWMTTDKDGTYHFEGMAPGTAEVYFPITNHRLQYFNDADDSRMKVVEVKSADATYIEAATGKTSNARVQANKYPMATVEIPEASAASPAELVVGFSQVTATAKVVLEGETAGQDGLASVEFFDGDESAVAKYGSGTGDSYHAMNADGSEHTFLGDQLGVKVTAKDGYKIKSVTAKNGATELAVTDLGDGKYGVNRADLTESFGQPNFSIVMEPVATPEPTETPAPTETETPAPTETDTPEVPLNPAVTVDDSAVNQGQRRVTATATGFKPNEPVNFEFHSTPVAIGSATTDASGVATITFDVPADATVGMHEVVVLQGDLEARTDIEVVAPTGTETPAPTETESETPAPVEPFVVVEHPSYSQAESKQGVEWLAGGLTPGEQAEAYLVMPNGERMSFDIDIDADGHASGTLTWATFDEDGNIIEDNLAFPEGEYTIVVVQGDKAVEAKFIVTADGAPVDPSAPAATDATDPAKPGDGEPGSGNGGLAETGAQDLSVLTGFAIVLTLAGAGVMLQRRRKA